MDATNTQIETGGTTGWKPNEWDLRGEVPTAEGLRYVYSPGLCFRCGVKTFLLTQHCHLDGHAEFWKEWESDPGDLYGVRWIKPGPSRLNGLASAVFMSAAECGHEGKAVLLCCYECSKNNGDKYRNTINEAVRRGLWRPKE